MWVILGSLSTKKEEPNCMKRFAMEVLKTWKEDSERLPMIIRGARQVGKTWLMKEFGASYFEKYAYINFDHNPRMQQLFSGDFNIDRILQEILSSV